MQPPSTLTQMTKIAVGVDRQAGADHGRPPAGLAGDRMLVGDELVAGQGMADQDGVAAVGVEPAIGLIGQGKRAEFDAAVEVPRPRRLLCAPRATARCSARRVRRSCCAG
jgi:hypothetical protein